MIPSDSQDRLAAAREHLRAGRFQEAEALLRAAVEAEPRHVEALQLLGDLARRAGRVEEALVLLERAAEVDPGNAAIQNELAVTHALRGEDEKAAAIWQRLESQHPTLAGPAHNLGRLREKQARWDEAIRCYERALRVDPLSLATYDHFSALLKERHDLARCADVLAQAVRHFPDNVALHLRYSYTLMMDGQLGPGWEEYEWRWRQKEATSRRHTQVPEWRGEPLSGRRILLWTEQGIGDSLHFIRYVELLAAQGAQVLVECQKEVKSLFLLIPKITAVRAVGEALPPFDLQLSLMSVPRVLGIDVARIPANVPYLYADPKKVRTWANRLERDGPGKRVGVVWAGGASHPGDHLRSLTLESLAFMAKTSGVRAYSLQLGPAAGQLAKLSGGALLDHTRFLISFEETAAMMAHLDLVVSVDTAAAHLAGALNRPVWTLIAEPCDWRWMHGRQDTPWYPSMRLYRQSAPGDWQSALAALERDFTSWANIA